MNEIRENEERLLSTLGLCVRAGKVVFGVPMICETLRRGRPTVSLVIEASDTSDNTHKRIQDRCGYYRVKAIQISADGAALAAALGKTSSLAAVAVTDPGMSKLVERCLSRQEET